MSSLFGGKEAIARPKVKVKIKDSWDSENFLYDSGAQVSLLLQVQNFHWFKLLTVNILGQVVKGPFFVSDVPSHAGVLGIDIIKKIGLSFDATTNIPYLPKKSEPARLARDKSQWRMSPDNFSVDF